MVRVYSGENPSQLYMEALIDLLTKGKERAPRGKRTLELHPALFEFNNPLSRVTFLKGRVINPFFQLAEALWIMAGRSDVTWLERYNSNIASFSDDGKFFNAPYGERLRYWGKNDARGWTINPLDQLVDCYKKLKEDPDTRQAVAFIGNPHFDNYDYTVGKGGKDIACNLNVQFSIQDNKLDITVSNRSNDLHWGTFGANLCQFTTIQETMASWLEIEVGSFYHVTNCLHVYLDDYGSKETDKICNAYLIDKDDPLAGDMVPRVKEFTFGDLEPRLTSDFATWHSLVKSYFTTIDPLVSNPAMYGNGPGLKTIIDNVPDDYLKMTFQAMAAYNAYKEGRIKTTITWLGEMADSSWKVSCLRFVSRNILNNKECAAEFKLLYKHLSDDIIDYIERKGE
ncbi:Thymidylate synthase [compost metagenome]